MKRRIKRPLTLLEIMIVIFLITLITGVIGYNMKGSLDKGKVFRTHQAMEQLHDMLLLALSDGETTDTILRNPADTLKKLNLAKDPDKLLKDGWGGAFAITANRARNDFIIRSENLKKYERRLEKGHREDDSDEE